MTDQELEAVYAASFPQSHLAGLKAVYASGQADGAKVSVEKQDEQIEGEFTQMMAQPQQTD